MSAYGVPFWVWRRPLSSGSSSTRTRSCSWPGCVRCAARKAGVGCVSAGLRATTAARVGDGGGRWTWARSGRCWRLGQEQAGDKTHEGRKGDVSGDVPCHWSWGRGLRDHGCRARRRRTHRQLTQDCVKAVDLPVERADLRFKVGPVAAADHAPELGGPCLTLHDNPVAAVCRSVIKDLTRSLPELSSTSTTRLAKLSANLRTTPGSRSTTEMSTIAEVPSRDTRTPVVPRTVTSRFVTPASCMVWVSTRPLVASPLTRLRTDSASVSEPGGRARRLDARHGGVGGGRVEHGPCNHHVDGHEQAQQQGAPVTDDDPLNRFVQFHVSSLPSRRPSCRLVSVSAARSCTGSVVVRVERCEPSRGDSGGGGGQDAPVGGHQPEELSHDVLRGIASRSGIQALQTVLNCL